MVITLLDLYTGPYNDTVVKTAQRISQAHDYALCGDLEAAYKLMRKFHDRMYPFDDSEIWARHNGQPVWHDPDDIYDIGWFTVDDDGNCELRDAAKEYLHFEIIDSR